MCLPDMDSYAIGMCRKQSVIPSGLNKSQIYYPIPISNKHLLF